MLTAGPEGRSFFKTGMQNAALSHAEVANWSRKRETMLVWLMYFILVPSVFILSKMDVFYCFIHLV